MSNSTHYFDTTDARDAWLTEHHPGRRAAETPGLYRCEDHQLAVFLNQVTIWPVTEPERPVYTCPQCGTADDVQGSAWIDLNTGEEQGECDDDYWCGTCDKHIDRVCLVTVAGQCCTFHDRPFTECREEETKP